MRLRMVLLAAAAALLAPASPAAAQPSMRDLLEACLQPPSLPAISRAAVRFKGAPDTAADGRDELGPHDPIIVPLPGSTNHAQRTRYDVSASHGWTLPGQPGGRLEYKDAHVQTDFVDTATHRPIGETRQARTRSCHFNLPVRDARKAFEQYDAMYQDAHGILIGSDRTWITVFRFDPDRFDIELRLQLEKPLPGVPPGDAPSGMSRLILSDAGPSFLNRVSPGVSVVSLTRAQLMTALETPALVIFGNTLIEIETDALAR